MTIIHGSVSEAKTWEGIEDESVQCVVTSPPYFSLRDYQVEGQLGLEKLHDCLGWARGENCGECYVCKMVLVFRFIWAKLRSDGVCFLNLGDSYAGSGGAGGDYNEGGLREGQPKWKSNFEINRAKDRKSTRWGGGKAPATGFLKPKDLMMVPARVALALQADGWWLRSDIIWCLSGGTWLYTRTQKGDMPMMLRDVARLDPKTVRLWTGQQWTQVLGWSKNKRTGEEMEIVLRSGERITCTPYHRFPVEGWPDGDKQARHLSVGMRLKRAALPEPAQPKDSAHIGTDIAWLCGLYIAEGSRSEDTIQIAGHAKEEMRWNRVRYIAESYGGSATRTIKGNNMSIRIYGKVLNSLIDQFVSGRIAKDKCLASVCWGYSNSFLKSMLEGYLSGDGCWDAKNRRWRLGFTRNYNLERDLRTLAARFGFRLVLNLATVKYKGQNRPTFKGEIRFEESEHGNRKSVNEIVEIRKGRCRETYDVGVEDEPHLFALASGILTHNSKPNPMPESVTDRPTKAHEYIFLLTKSADYYFDQEAVREENADPDRKSFAPGKRRMSDDMVVASGDKHRGFGATGKSMEEYIGAGRNIRSVWHIPTQPFPGAHFATFPERIPELCIKAGTSEKGCCVKCGSPMERVTENVGSNKANESEIKRYESLGVPRTTANLYATKERGTTKTLGWKPTCTCNAGTKPCIVLDPFVGSGTTGEVALRLGRRFVGIELNEKYINEIAKPRLEAVNPLFTGDPQ